MHWFAQPASLPDSLKDQNSLFTALSCLPDRFYCNPGNPYIITQCIFLQLGQTSFSQCPMTNYHGLPLKDSIKRRFDKWPSAKLIEHCQSSWAYVVQRFVGILALMEERHLLSLKPFWIQNLSLNGPSANLNAKEDWCVSNQQERHMLVNFFLLLFLNKKVAWISIGLRTIVHNKIPG